MSDVTTSKHLFWVNFLTGISDGLILPFASAIFVYPFFNQEPVSIFVSGISVTLLLGAMFGWARYLGEREEIRHHHPDMGGEDVEKEQVLLKHIGIAPEVTEKITREQEIERALWLREIRENGMGWDHADKRRAWQSGLHTAAGFWVGGVLVVAPFLLMGSLLYAPAICALFCWCLYGFAKARITGGSVYKTSFFFLIKATLLSATSLMLALLIAKIA